MPVARDQAQDEGEKRARVLRVERAHERVVRCRPLGHEGIFAYASRRVEGRTDRKGSTFSGPPVMYVAFPG
ncbi:hypothetical protein TPA0910_23300 [Streptomyces hygroscopicus subsp. sporocinereus]|uniref:Uncharacterized protein n=1 Tax=Streptomyces hygroscopicus TaxID=1912 RepID=A0ABQ3TX36_STRHY|nr:hypothetical protein TPA0910_23300 [Streptomyces hygroscopicus]